MNQIGKINIDFTVIQELNPQLIKVQDNSDWFFAEDKSATIIITPPGSSKGIVNVFAKKETNTFNSSNLGLSCITECTDQVHQPLSDGIWKITLQSIYQGLEKKRYYLKTDTFRIEWAKEFVNLGLEYVNTKDLKYEALYDCIKHLDTANSFTLDGDFTKANREFTEAQKKFNKIRKCQHTL